LKEGSPLISLNIPGGYFPKRSYSPKYGGIKDLKGTFLGFGKNLCKNSLIFEMKVFKAPYSRKGFKTFRRQFGPIVPNLAS